VNDTDLTRRSIGDKLLILGAHLNANPELPESINISQGFDGELVVHLDNDAISGLRAWVSTLIEVTWKAQDFRDPKWSSASWHVFASGTIAVLPVSVLPVSVWSGIPGDYADTADAVIAKLTESTVGVR
jgi:hypothetical protein